MPADSAQDPGLDPATLSNVVWFNEAPTIDDFLLHLARQIFRLLNEREYDSSLFRIIAENDQIDFDDSIVYGRSAFLEQYRLLGERDPAHRAELFNTSIELDASGSNATVLGYISMVGYHNERRRGCLVKLHWRRTSGRWRCIAHSLVYGCPVRFED